MMICLYFSSNGSFNEEGVGDCRTCTPDDKNKKCKKYFPIPDWRKGNQQTHEPTTSQPEQASYLRVS
jgi:hypothetical protein